MEDYPSSRLNDLVMQDSGKEVLLYDLQVNKAFCLNEMSSIVWKECTGKNTVSDISKILSQKLKEHFSEDLVWLAVHQFKKDNLLIKNDDFFTPFDGLNRREIIKKIGLASIISLPVISSIVAPMAIQANSGACAFPLNCTPGNSSDLSDDGCLCNSNLECQGVCPVTPSGVPRYCVGGGTGSFCAPGNIFDLSAPCCSCNSNLECQGVCPITPSGIPRVCV
jgi:hypothetical protein